MQETLKAGVVQFIAGAVIGTTATFAVIHATGAEQLARQALDANQKTAAEFNEKILPELMRQLAELRGKAAMPAPGGLKK